MKPSGGSEFFPLLDDMLLVRLYGKKVEDITLRSGSRITGYPDSGLTVALVHGAKVLGRCQTLPVPVLMILPDNGKPTDSTACAGFQDGGFSVWTLPKESACVKLDYAVGAIEQLLDQPSTRLEQQSDFHFYEVSVGPDSTGALALTGKLHIAT